MGIRQKLLTLITAVAALTLLPGVAAATAAPLADGDTQSTGHVEVSVDLLNAPSDGVDGTIDIALTCGDPASTVVKTASIARDSVPSIEFSAIPVGTPCVASVVDLPLPPTGYGWGTLAESDPVSIAAEGDTATASVAVPLNRLHGDLAISLGALGVAQQEISLVEELRIDCGSDFRVVRTITLDSERSGSVEISGIPNGATCLVQADSDTVAPDGLTWSDATISPASVTIREGSTAVVEVRRTAAPVAASGGAAEISVAIFGGPASGLTGSMQVSVSCDAGDFDATVAFASTSTGTVLVEGLPMSSDCLARAQSLPTIPAGYQWYGASPIEMTMFTVAEDSPTTVQLFGRLEAVPVVVPAPTVVPPVTPPAPVTPAPVTTTVTLPSAPAPVVESTAATNDSSEDAFAGLQAPTLATSDRLLETGSPEAAPIEEAPTVEAWLMAAIGLLLVLLGAVVAGLAAIRIITRHRRHTSFA